ncbi:MAG: thioredoxin family protein [Fibrobacteres bacterium]|nr:thioredoxin family protein [Fibrobacterota bacterium]
MKRSLPVPFLIRVFCLLALAFSAAAPRAEEAKHVRAELLAASDAVPDQTLQAGLHLKLDPHWHVYWKYPGDAGLPVSIAWTLPPGWSADSIQWPYPERISLPPLMNYGYGDEVLLPIRIHVPKNASGSAELKAKAKWVVCQEICLPGGAELTLNVSTTSSAALTHSQAELFGKALAAVPAPSAWTFSAQASGDKVVLIAKGPAGADLASLSFFPDQGDQIDNPSPQSFYPVAGGFAVETKLAPPAEEGGKGPDSLTGVAVADPGFGKAKATEFRVAIRRGAALPKALAAPIVVSAKAPPPGNPGVTSGAIESISLPSSAASHSMAGSPAAGAAISAAISTPGSAPVGGAATGTMAGADSAAAPAGFGRLLLALMGAFVGGLILNLMPCVLPVLSLKIFDFVKRAGESRWKVFSHGLVFTAGVLASFWALAGLLLILRSTGAGLGWGFQLQSPVFLMVLCVLFTFFALSLFGVFEIGATFTRLGSAQGHDGWWGSFLAGVTATVVATPCTAPYMGSALGFAFTQPAYFAMLVFTAIGLGMASPYLILSGFPRLMKFLPKPGAWMETLKQFMGFPLLGTAIWLAWVLGQQAGVDALIALLFVLLLSGLSAWILGKWTPIYHGMRTRILGMLAAAVVFVPAFAYVAAHLDEYRDSKPRTVSAVGGGPAMLDHGIAWEPFSESRLSELISQGKPTLVDFTADWCLSCKVNERVALTKPEVSGKIKELGLTALKADWTLRDESISRALAKYGRNSIPLYVLYTGRGDEHILLPEVITPAVVLDALGKVNGPVTAL